MTNFDDKPVLARTVFLTVTTLVVAYSALWLYRYTSVVTDENLYDDINGRVTIIAIVPGGASDHAGLQVGDSIIAINGNPVGNKYEANDYLVEGGEGHTLRYTVIRGEKTLDLPVVIAEFGLPLQYLSAVLTALLLLGLAVFVYVKRTTNRIARLFGWTNLVFSFALLVHRNISIFHYPDLLTAGAFYLHPLLWPTVVTLYLHLTLYFPLERYVRAVSSQLMTALYVLPFTVFIVLLLFSPLLGGAGPYVVLVQLVGLTGSVVAVRHIFRNKMKNVEVADYHRRARPVSTILICSALYAAALLMVSLSSYPQYLFMVGLLLPICLFLIIVRQRLFDLYIVLRKRSLYSVLNYSLSFIVVFLLIAAIIHIPQQKFDVPVLNLTGGQVEVLRLSSLPTDRRVIFERRFSFTAGLLIAAMLYWFHQNGKKILNKRFYRGSLDYKRALTSFSELSHSHVDMLTLSVAAVSSVVRLLHVRDVLFTQRSKDSFSLLSSQLSRIQNGSVVIDITTVETLDSAFEKSSVVAVDNLPVRDRFVELGIEFLVGVFLDQRLEAVLLLSEKESDINYSREDVELLKNLSMNLTDALRTMRFYDRAREMDRFRKELEIARHIQMQALPVKLPEFPGIKVAARSLPAYEVGGDFYDVLPRHASVMFLIGDVSGKGTSAAMYLARLQGILRTIESFEPSPWELLTRLNTLLFEHIDRKSFVTIAVLQFDFLTSEVRFLRAGHLPLLHYNAMTKETAIYQPAGMALGLDPYTFSDQLQEEVIFSRTDDVFVLVSDGITETANADGVQFGIEGVAKCVSENAAGSATDIMSAITSAVSKHGAAEQADDITVLVVKNTIHSDA